MPTAQTPANLESPQTRMYACLRRFQVGRSLRCWHRSGGGIYTQGGAALALGYVVQRLRRKRIGKCTCSWTSRHFSQVSGPALWRQSARFFRKKSKSHLLRSCGVPPQKFGGETPLLPQAGGSSPWLRVEAPDEERRDWKESASPLPLGARPFYTSHSPIDLRAWRRYISPPACPAGPPLHFPNHPQTPRSARN